MTRDWWNKRRTEFDLYISQVVLRECQAGDSTAAADRLKVLQDLPLLEQTETATLLAQALVDQVPLPERAAVDALHIAIAAVNGMDYLLTWNCTHVANVTLQNRSTRCAVQMGMNRRRFAHLTNCWRRKETDVDDILREVRNTREAYAKQFGYDLQAIHCDLKAQERASGRQVVSLPPRRPKLVMASKDGIPGSSAQGND